MPAIVLVIETAIKHMKFGYARIEVAVEKTVQL
jgi:hypothetical protein